MFRKTSKRMESPKFSNHFIREAMREMASLSCSDEGYVIRTKWYDKSRGVLMSTLKHKSNGNVISIIANRSSLTIRKNGKVVKQL